MKNFILILIFFLILISEQRSSAQTVITATITVTNTFITNGNTITVQGTTYLVTNTPVSLAHIASTNPATAAATNIYTKFASALTNRFSVRYGSSTSVKIQTYVGQTISASISTNWGTLVFTTNTAGNASVGASNVHALSITLSGTTIDDWTDISGSGVTNNQYLPGTPVSTNGNFTGVFGMLDGTVGTNVSFYDSGGDYVLNAATRQLRVGSVISLDWFNLWLNGTWRANAALFTNLPAANIAAGTAQISITGHAPTAGSVTNTAGKTNITRIFDVTAYGAILTDAIVGLDHAALQTCQIDAEQCGGAAEIRIPQGTLWFSPISYRSNYFSENAPSMMVLLNTNQVTYQGSGINQTVFKCFPTNGVDSGGNFNWFGGGDTISSNYPGPQNLIFRDLMFDGNFSQSASNIDYLYDTTQFYPSVDTRGSILFERVAFKNFPKDAIDAAGYSIVALDCTFTNVGSSAMKQGYYRNCILVNCGWYAPTATDGYAIEMHAGNKGVYENCTIIGGPIDILIDQAYAVFKNCTFYNTNTGTILGFVDVGPMELELDNCQVFQSATPTDYLIKPKHASSRVVIRGGRYDGLILSATNSQFVTIDSYAQFYNNTTPTLPSVVIQSCPNLSIKNSLFFQGGFDAIRFPSGSRVDNASISGNFFIGANVTFSSGSISTNTVISGNTWPGTSGNFRTFSGSAYQFNIANNSFSGGGVVLESGSNFISGNELKTVTFQTGGIVGNHFRNNRIWAAPAGTTYIQTNQIWSGNTWSNSLVPYDPNAATEFTASVTIPEYLGYKTVRMDGSSLTTTLKSAAAYGKGWWVTVLNENASSLTMATTSSQTVNGTTPPSLTQWQSRTFESDGANWIMTGGL